MVTRILVIILFNLLVSLNSFGQQISASAMRSVILFKIPEHIDWPNETTLDVFHIAVYKDTALFRELHDLSRKARIKNIPVTVSQISTFDIPQSIQILAIGQSANGSIETAFQKIKGRPVLLITDNAAAQKFVMINFLNSGKRKNQISFEVNKKNIIEQGIQVHPELLLLGGSEIDIRELYNKSEQSLKEEQKRVEQQKIELDSQRITIQEYENKIASQKEIVIIQNKNIRKQKDSIQNLALRISNINSKLNEREDLLILREKKLFDVSHDIQLKSKIILSQKSSIDSQIHVLQVQKNEIKLQKDSINKQKATLQNQVVEINSQRNAIVIISILFMVVLFLGILTYKILREKQAANKLLNLKTEEITIQKEKLELQTEMLLETNNELESFSYSVSHDLRAPLRSIDGFSQILLIDYNESLDEQGRNYLNRIRAASQRMGVLIEEILKLSRVQRQELVRTEINLSDMALKIVNELIAIENLPIASFNILPGISAFADYNLIQIVLVNLIGNAVKYSSKVEKPQISFSTKLQNEKMVYIISDNGVGFDMTYYNKLFGAFQRLHTNDEFKGLGIGLSIVKRIINRHGGRIWAESNVGQGATFYFTL